MERYALYFAPAEGTPLDRFGAAWLGRDARSGAGLAASELAGLAPDEVMRLTAAPRLYGFHGTLKPPFALAAGKSAAQLIAATAGFAAGQAAFAAPPLRLAALGRFLALIPDGAAPALGALAQAAMTALDPFRAPPDAAELAKRRAAGLTPRQEANLARWGYPYVGEEFRFHMTLTDALEPALRARVAAALEPLVAPFRERPLRIDAVALFRQPGREAPFRLIESFPLAAAAGVPA